MRAMIQRRWVLPMAAMALAVTAGCGGSPQEGPGGVGESQGPPAFQVPVGTSGQVDNVQARCGVQGVFWQNNWWLSNPPIQAVKNETANRVLAGTMTSIGNNQARLDSPDLQAPQILSLQLGRTELTPPFAACAPLPGTS